MPLLALLLIAVVSLVIVRVGATALKMTGLSSQVADFQAVSCFFGVGFTTSESEMIVSHPARRKIATYLIISGNIGLTSALSALIVTFVNNERDPLDWLDTLFVGHEQPMPFGLKLAIVIAMVLLIGLVFRLVFVRRLLEGVIRAMLNKSRAVRAMDYDTVLHAKDGFVVSHFEVNPDHPMVGRTLGQVALGHRGVIVIGILRDDGAYVGTPHRDTTIHAGDVLTVYGVEGRLREELNREDPAREERQAESRGG